MPRSSSRRGQDRETRTSVGLGSAAMVLGAASVGLGAGALGKAYYVQSNLDDVVSGRTPVPAWSAPDPAALATPTATTATEPLVNSLGQVRRLRASFSSVTRDVLELAPSSSARVRTDLGLGARGADSLALTSSTGAGVALPRATAEGAGLMGAADVSRLRNVLSATPGAVTTLSGSLSCARVLQTDPGPNPVWYVDAASGDDSKNTGLDPALPAATVQHCLDQVTALAGRGELLGRGATVLVAGPVHRVTATSWSVDCAAEVVVRAEGGRVVTPTTVTAVAANAPALGAVLTLAAPVAGQHFLRDPATGQEVPFHAGSGGGGKACTANRFSPPLAAGAAVELVRLTSALEINGVDASSLAGSAFLSLEQRHAAGSLRLEGFLLSSSPTPQTSSQPYLFLGGPAPGASGYRAPPGAAPRPGAVVLHGCAFSRFASVRAEGPATLRRVRFLAEAPLPAANIFADVGLSASSPYAQLVLDTCAAESRWRFACSGAGRLDLVACAILADDGAQSVVDMVSGAMSMFGCSLEIVSGARTCVIVRGPGTLWSSRTLFKNSVPNTLPIANVQLAGSLRGTAWGLDWQQETGRYPLFTLSSGATLALNDVTGTLRGSTGVSLCLVTEASNARFLSFSAGVRGGITSATTGSGAPQTLAWSSTPQLLPDNSATTQETWVLYDGS